MATTKLIILSLACVLSHAFPQEPTVPLNRNTIFGDEKIENGVFEDVNSLDSVTLRNVAANLYRLPTTTRPRHYNVLWAIDISRLTFSGTVDIELYATQANISEIVIHADDLQILSLRLQLGNNVLNSNYTLEQEYQFLRVQSLGGSLQFNATNPVIYTLTIEFAAPLRTDMYGIYQSWFRNNATDSVR